MTKSTKKKSRLGDRFKQQKSSGDNQDTTLLQDLQKTVDILDIEYVKPTSLSAHPENRTYYSGFDGEEYETLKADIQRAGKVLKPIEISRESGLVVAGNRRLQAALELNLTSIPIIRRPFATDEDELDYLIKDNILQRQLSRADHERIIEQRFKDRILDSNRGGDRRSSSFKDEQTERLDQEISRRLGIAESTVRKCLATIRKRYACEATRKVKDPAKLEQFGKKLQSWEKTFNKFDFNTNEREQAINQLQMLIRNLKKRNSEV